MNDGINSIGSKLAILKAVMESPTMVGELSPAMMDKGINTTTVRDEISHVEQTARTCFGYDGNCKPVLLFYSDDGSVLITAVTPIMNLGDLGKDYLAFMIRTWVRQHSETMAVIFVTEAWISKATKTGKPTGKRNEVVHIHAESRDGGIFSKIIPINRNPDGTGTLGEGEVHDESNEPGVGRFVGFFKQTAPEVPQV